MVLQPLKRTKLYEDIIKQILGMIRSGELCPGDKLPPERSLCEQLSVSRPAIREALRVLESMGYVESRVGDGTFVRSISLDDLMDPFSDIFAQSGDAISNLVEVRLILEPQIAAIATRRITPAQIENLEAILDAMQREIDGGAFGIREDEQFHMELARSTNNDALSTIYEMCRKLLSETITAVLQKQPDQPRIALKEHRRILEAIKRKDGEAAAIRIYNHLQRNFGDLSPKTTRDDCLALSAKPLATAFSQAEETDA